MKRAGMISPKRKKIPVSFWSEPLRFSLTLYENWLINIYGSFFIFVLKYVHGLHGIWTHIQHQNRTSPSIKTILWNSNRTHLRTFASHHFEWWSPFSTSNIRFNSIFRSSRSTTNRTKNTQRSEPTHVLSNSLKTETVDKKGNHDASECVSVPRPYPAKKRT